MAKINLLDPSVFNMIAAGEVVERPASVVKELVENSIDAGATQIDVTIIDGGLKRIQVSDNGIGIEKDDIRSAFLPHATSKLQHIRDLDTLSSLGFRGEALASIASVSEVTLISRTAGDDTASYIYLVGGKVVDERVDSRAKGTSITVENLFFNTPARLKFMKASSAEQRAIISTIEKIVFANPLISITVSDAKGMVFEHQGGELKDAICSIWGSDTFENMLPIEYEKAGKSTYMRQVALIVLMAHIGCFVPADSAEIALTDRIFTRIGASDDLSGGQSTFMVEMIEVATILNYATSSSLLILDEIGRGTSTFDGLSIAWAVLEYITKNVKAKTLFATHFHELTELEDLEGVKNYRVLVSEHNDTIIFLHKIARGGASRSFGIEVASLAGVLKPVVDHAKRIMASLEEDAKNRDTNSVMLSSTKSTKTAQVSLFDTPSSKIEEEIKALNVDSLTPLQALTILADINKRLNGN